MDAGTPTRRAARLGALLALAVAALCAPTSASAAPTEGCTTPDAGTVREYTCYWKPPPVGGYAVEQAVEFSVPKPNVTGHVTHMEVDVVDQNTDPVPISRLMLHHIVFLNSNNGRQDRTCAGRGYAGFGEEKITGNFASERFYAAGEERAKISFPAGYGYRIEPGHVWSLVYMFMNHRPQTDDDAWVQYKVRVDTSNSLEPVIPYWLDAANCRADPIYNVAGMSPKAKKRARRRARQRGNLPLRVRRNRTADFTIKEDGWIVAGAGHVHGGADKLAITKPSCNNLQVARSVPTWGLPDHEFYNVRPVLHEPGPIGMSAFGTTRGIPVRNGQTIRLNSIYDGVRPHTRVMGIFVVYLAKNQNPAVDGTPQACGGAPGDITYGPGTNLVGRPGPIPYRIPLTGIDPATGLAKTIAGPPGAFRALRSDSTVDVGDRFFDLPNIRLRKGARLNYNFSGGELHNLTLANGPLGIGSPNLNGNRDFSQRFTRVGTYRFFCGLHPTQMSQRVVVKQPKKKRRR